MQPYRMHIPSPRFFEEPVVPVLVPQVPQVPWNTRALRAAAKWATKHSDALVTFAIFFFFLCIGLFGVSLDSGNKDYLLVYVLNPVAVIVVSFGLLMYQEGPKS